MKICVFIFLFFLFSCQGYNNKELGNLSNYGLVKKDTTAIGTKREVYYFKKDNIYSFEKLYWPDGNLMSESFLKNNRFNGLCTLYTPDGKLNLKIYYKRGLKNGPLIGYDKNGRINKCEVYKDGRLISEGCQ